MKKTRLVSLFPASGKLPAVLCLLLALALLPGTAARAAEEPPAAAAEEDLFYGYMLSLAGGGDGAMLQATGEQHLARAQLTDQNKWFYDQFLPEIEKIASGERSDTTIVIEYQELNGKHFTAEELGVSGLLSGGEISKEAESALTALLPAPDAEIVDALLADCPYALYWYDKTVGWHSETHSGIFHYDSTGPWLYLDGPCAEFSFAVEQQYAKPVGDTQYSLYETNAAMAVRAVTAAANARAVVDGSAVKSDWEKLDAYREEICELASYNDYAAEEENGVPYGDPWQLIYVFDGDPETNVVCEGYAKAFQYLCDLSTFSGDTRCWSVTGNMTGATGEGPHMWNIVSLNGTNYLADITNCDAGSAGAPDKLFLAGATLSEDVYTVEIPNHSIRYVYDKKTAALWRNSGILDISDTTYIPYLYNGTCGEGESEVHWAVTKDYILTVSGSAVAGHQALVGCYDSDRRFAQALLPEYDPGTEAIRCDLGAVPAYLTVFLLDSNNCPVREQYELISPGA